MRIIALNANGIRSAKRKGFFQWLEQQQADIVCIQETKAQTDQLLSESFWPNGFNCYYHDAQKRGYSGVAIFCKQQPSHIAKGIGWLDMDEEGRFIEAQFDSLSVISLYLPSGTSNQDRQAVKFSFLDRFMPYLQNLSQNGRDYIICGDWNIAHKEIDLKTGKTTRRTPVFYLRNEPGWMSFLIAKTGSMRFV